MASRRLLVELYYDVISPYSYLCFEALCRYRQPWNMDLKLKPFYLGAVMKETGNAPPAMVPNRARYMLKDLSVLSRYYQVPLTVPKQFMEWVMTKSTVNAQRFICALYLQKPDLVEPVTRAFFQRLFGEQKEIMSLECIPEVARSAGVPEDVMKSCLDALKSEEVKTTLKKHVDEALELNAFGAPTIVAHINDRKEMFFGQDRLYLLAHEAGKEWLGPFPRAANKL